MKDWKLLPEACKLERIYYHASQPNLLLLRIKRTIKGSFKPPLYSIKTKIMGFLSSCTESSPHHTSMAYQKKAPFCGSLCCLSSSTESVATCCRTSSKCPKSPKALVLTRYHEQLSEYICLFPNPK